GRALLLQGIDAPANAQAAAQQLNRTQVLKADRGVILDRNGQVLAETQPAFQVIADPWSISSNGYDRENMTAEQAAKARQAPGAIAAILATYLGGRKSDYLRQLTRVRNDDGSPNQYELIKRKVSAALYQQMATELKNGGWYGIYPATDPVRYYPNGTLASNVIGFVNYEDQGAAGLEYQHDAQLSGIDGKQTYQQSPYGPIPLGDSTLVEPVDGTTFQLTIDAELQWMAQTELANAVANANARSGTVVIMAVQTGEVLAMATVPTFDSNNPGEANTDDLGNRAITDAYEPGSVQKVLTMAALLDAGLITADTPVEVPSQIMSGGAPINDAWAHGTLYLTARGVLAQSSNIGTVQLTRQIDKATLSNYLASFGLGSSTGIELPGETGGAMGVLPGADMADYTRDQISFGQGLSVTAIQQAAALASVVNGGVYHQPTVISSAHTAAGDSVPFERKEPYRVISEEASAAVVNMMEASVASPEMTTLDAMTIPGYRMAGKSGTAQKIGDYGNYDGGYTGSYVAVAPAEDPQLLVYVVIDEPTNGYYGGVVAFPSARELMIQALPRYGIAPATNVPEFTDPLSYLP
ncbi:MAG: penicillin-binding protein 2, partial [Brooklawnia sp.]|uniref:peptidoglycan D,D-transpeptidase FtsI family protein n=1 Tax=Brooklawnia sp. TaxID=2699740 RepID=UPI003C780794